MRLELSTRTDLAIRAMNVLHERDGRVARTELAQTLGTTPDFLARIMAVLVSHGWVESRSGPQGGYTAGETISSASVYDVIDAVEGIPRDGVCVLRSGSCDAEDPCALHDAWTRARKALLEELRGSPVIE